MRQAIRIFLFVTAFVFLHTFAACTGTSSHPSDAEGFAGNKQKYFYNHLTEGQVLGVSLNDTSKEATLFSITGSVIAKVASLVYENIRITNDGMYLTLLGQSQIFEMNAAAPATVAQPGFTLPATTIDTLCFSSDGQGSLLGTTGYSEVRVTRVSGGFNLVAIGPLGSASLLQSVAARSDSGVEVGYLSGGIGLHIKEKKPNSTDADYFESFIDAAVSSSTDWTTANQMICHLNLPAPVKVGTVPPNPMVSTTATSFALSAGAFGWGNLSGALTKDGVFADSFFSSYGDDSEPLLLSGYFTDPKYKLPENATVDGIKVNCSWYYETGLNGNAQEKEVYLLKAGVPVGINKSNFTDIPVTYSSAPPPLLLLSEDFGSSIDTWGVTQWLPSDINSAAFGVWVNFKDNSLARELGVLHIDYCQVAVYWR